MVVVMVMVMVMVMVTNFDGKAYLDNPILNCARTKNISIKKAMPNAAAPDDEHDDDDDDDHGGCWMLDGWMQDVGWRW